MTGYDPTFRPLAPADLPLLSGWLAESHVFEFWQEQSDPAIVDAAYLPAIRGEDPTEVFVIELDARPVGLIQRYLISDYPEWVAAFPPEVAGVDTAVGIDYLIGDRGLTGKGLGSTVIRRFTADSLDRYPEADAVIVACQQANPASWRALEKAGYDRGWAGMLDSDDPSDAGPSYVYRRRRVPGPPSHP